MRANKHYEKWVNDYTEVTKHAKANHEYPGGSPWAPGRHLRVRLSGNNASVKLFALVSLLPLVVCYFLRQTAKAASHTVEAIMGSWDVLRDTD